MLVAPDGTIALEAENSVTTENDVTHHAETNLVHLASRTIPLDQLAKYTLYTSCEPCAMCTGAIFWAGIGRVVYALSETGLAERWPPCSSLTTTYVSSQAVLSRC
ncbi:nucleoside deaminase [Streptomyces atratus]|uniref:nucleoside deaminase n=1 Tax=Streptomyces atratus TaxID=1893 RepID=UPI0036CE5188